MMSLEKAIAKVTTNFAVSETPLTVDNVAAAFRRYKAYMNADADTRADAVNVVLTNAKHERAYIDGILADAEKTTDDAATVDDVTTTDDDATAATATATATDDNATDDAKRVYTFADVVTAAKNHFDALSHDVVTVAAVARFLNEYAAARAADDATIIKTVMAIREYHAANADYSTLETKRAANVAAAAKKDINERAARLLKTSNAVDDAAAAMNVTKCGYVVGGQYTYVGDNADAAKLAAAADMVKKYAKRRRANVRAAVADIRADYKRVIAREKRAIKSRAERRRRELDRNDVMKFDSGTRFDRFDNCMKRVTDTYDAAPIVSHGSNADAERAAAVYSLAAAVTRSMLKKVADPQRKSATAKRGKVSKNGMNAVIRRLNAATYADYRRLVDVANVENAAHYFDANGARKELNNALVSTTFDDAADIIHNAVVEILSQIDRMKNDNAPIDFEREYTYKKRARTVVIDAADIEYHDATTAPISAIHAAARRTLINNRAAKVDTGKYVYIADAENGYIRRAAAELPYITIDNNGIVTTDLNTIQTIDNLIDTLNLTATQAKVIKYRARGYSYDAIAKHNHVSKTAVFKTAKQVQKKAHTNDTFAAHMINCYNELEKERVTELAARMRDKNAAAEKTAARRAELAERNRIIAAMRTDNACKTYAAKRAAAELAAAEKTAARERAAARRAELAAAAKNDAAELAARRAVDVIERVKYAKNTERVTIAERERRAAAAIDNAAAVYAARLDIANAARAAAATIDAAERERAAAIAARRADATAAAKYAATAAKLAAAIDDANAAAVAAKLAADAAALTATRARIAAYNTMVKRLNG